MQHGGGGWSANVFFAFSAKSVTEKTTAGLNVRKQTKDRASLEVQGWGLCPAELSVINFQA